MVPSHSDVSSRISVFSVTFIPSHKPVSKNKLQVPGGTSEFWSPWWFYRTKPVQKLLAVWRTELPVHQFVVGEGDISLIREQSSVYDGYRSFSFCAERCQIASLPRYYLPGQRGNCGKQSEQLVNNWWKPLGSFPAPEKTFLYHRRTFKAPRKQKEKQLEMEYHRIKGLILQLFMQRPLLSRWEWEQDRYRDRQWDTYERWLTDQE